MAQCQWSPGDLTHNINWLELRAIHLALLSFQDIVLNQNILILTDNVAAKAHVNRLGGTHSQPLLQEAVQLGLWAEAHLRSIRASHISGVANTQADWLSRVSVDQGEWRLNPDMFLEITLRFGNPLVDLFATRDNRQLDWFFSRYPVQGAEGIDALRSPWPPGLLYAFPPIPTIPKVIRKMLREQAELILLAPHWPRRPWFADLVALSVVPPWKLPQTKISLSQGQLTHPDPQWFKLTAWRLSGVS
ncbi:uncharacterized protein LOC131203279 [Ahaetulla prasina]|uniref:uncharacterized protein LOC131203279 n=1 Tax=Ahaetulla prasina TaxID=499056 RepID=UPI0026471FB7|nr:uncharacterized protein LOC131203279 [Ahaetulla prasina]